MFLLFLEKKTPAARQMPAIVCLDGILTSKRALVHLSKVILTYVFIFSKFFEKRAIHTQIIAIIYGLEEAHAQNITYNYSLRETYTQKTHYLVCVSR